MSFALDPRLVADTHAIGALPFSELLLMDDARYPWVILVPRIAGDQRLLLGEIDRVARALESLLNPDKLNIAALGNVVAQLHVHVIARFTSDAAWPNPVWGRGERVIYGERERAARIAALRAALGGETA